MASWLRDSFFQLRKDLPRNYIGIHIRNTDLTTDWEPVFEKANARRKGRPVFLATDSAIVRSSAIQFFGEELVFTAGGSLPADNSELHPNYSDLGEESRRENVRNTWMDLLLVSNGDMFFHSTVREREGVSGYSRLAGFLFRNRSVKARMLAAQPALFGGRRLRRSILVGSPVDRGKETFRGFGARWKRQLGVL